MLARSVESLFFCFCLSLLCILVHKAATRKKNILLKSRILFLNLMLFDLKRSGLKLLPGLMNILSAIIFLMIADYAHI